MTGDLTTCIVCIERLLDIVTDIFPPLCASVRVWVHFSLVFDGDCWRQLEKGQQHFADFSTNKWREWKSLFIGLARIMIIFFFQPTLFVIMMDSRHLRKKVRLISDKITHTLTFHDPRQHSSAAWVFRERKKNKLFPSLGNWKLLLFFFSFVIFGKVVARATFAREVCRLIFHGLMTLWMAISLSHGIS